MRGIVYRLLAWMLLVAAPVPLPSAGSFESEMLAEHNLIRAEVRVPPLRWSAGLTAVAQKWANTLLSNGRFEHQPRSPYGENLFAAMEREVTPAEIVGWWASESADYDYVTNTCSGTCGHYTQLVWRKTQQVGCATAQGHGRQVIVCEYDPPGNWEGQRPW